MVAGTDFFEGQTGYAIIYIVSQMLFDTNGGDAFLGPGVNPLEGSPNVKLRKLGPKGTLPASNSRKG
jgi:hypothetical protein